MSAPHDPPSINELLEAIREFLETEAIPALEGGVRFHARIAVNALSIVVREMSLGAEQSEAQRIRLEELGFRTEDELAAAIRSGSLDGRYAEVAAVVRQTVRDKLMVADPSYLAEVPSEGKSAVDVERELE